LTLNLDASPPGTALQLSISRTHSDAIIELHGPPAFSAADAADPSLNFSGGAVPRAQLILAGARHWLPKAGGRLDIVSAQGAIGVLRILCPLSVA
jgi:hypothetical protein